MKIEKSWICLFFALTIISLQICCVDDIPEGIQADFTCAICMEEVAPGKNTYDCPQCKHVFHLFPCVIDLYAACKYKSAAVLEIPTFLVEEVGGSPEWNFEPRNFSPVEDSGEFGFGSPELFNFDFPVSINYQVVFRDMKPKCPLCLKEFSGSFLMFLDKELARTPYRKERSRSGLIDEILKDLQSKNIICDHGCLEGVKQLISDCVKPTSLNVWQITDDLLADIVRYYPWYIAELIFELTKSGNKSFRLDRCLLPIFPTYEKICYLALKRLSRKSGYSLNTALQIVKYAAKSNTKLEATALSKISDPHTVATNGEFGFLKYCIQFNEGNSIPEYMWFAW
jgi:hypothetical protein